MRSAVGSPTMWTRGRGVARRTEELSHGDRDAGAVRPPAVDQPAETAEDEEPGSLAPGPLIHGHAVARDPLGRGGHSSPAGSRGFGPGGGPAHDRPSPGGHPPG